MKIKIKSREEIEKTLDKYGYHVDRCGAYFLNLMFLECGKQLKAERLSYGGYSASTGSSIFASGACGWHKDWYEVIDPDFTQEDLMDIELMDEMLAYFLSI